MRFLSWFKQQNWAIKVGYVAMVVSLIALLLGLILIGTANFVPENSAATDKSLVGNGFELMYKNGISSFLSNQGYSDFARAFARDHFQSAPLAQLVSGIVFLVIVLPTFGGICSLTLLGGYLRRWLYT